MRTSEALVSLAAKRRERFLERVDEGLSRLQDAGVLDEIPDSDAFDDVLLHATELAIHSSDEEKFIAFANIVLNLAITPLPEHQNPHAFFLSLDRIPLLHLHLLHCLNTPAKHYRALERNRSVPQPRGVAVKLFDFIFQMFPQLNPRLDSQLHARILYELHGQNLIHSIDRNRDHFSSNDDAFRVTTTYGATFIRLITAPEVDPRKAQQACVLEVQVSAPDPAYSV